MALEIFKMGAAPVRPSPFELGAPRMQRGTIFFRTWWTINSGVICILHLSVAIGRVNRDSFLTRREGIGPLGERWAILHLWLQVRLQFRVGKFGSTAFSTTFAVTLFQTLALSTT
jgi:hypothetical protein